MNGVRPLARTPTYVPGESFASYVDRLAAMHKVDLLVILHQLGMIHDEKYEIINGYGALMSEKQLEKFCTVTRMTIKQAAAMLMTSYDGTVLNLSGADPGNPQSLRKWACDNWAYFSATHVCPQCVLEDGGVWKLAWKLPWTFACTKHKCYLVPYCPGCKRRFRAGRRDGRLSPVFVRKVPVPGECNNPKRLGESAGKGKAAVACGYSLAEISVQSARRSALAAQKKVNEALAGVPQTILGVMVSPQEFFADLRSLCALILYCAETSDLDLSDFERDAFASFADKRNAAIVARKESALPRNSGRVRTFIGPPDDPGLMAGVVRHALKILAATDQEAMSDMIKPIAERCIARTTNARWEAMRYFRFSERLGPSIHKGLAQSSSFDRSMGNRSLLAQKSHYTFEPSHVPQLLWAADFEKNFSAFFPNIKRNYARRFCAMSLVKLCGGYTWGEAAMFLGLPEHHSIKLANRCVGFLADEKTKYRFSHNLHAVARRLSEQNEKVNYGQRRSAFSELFDIQDDVWLSICQQAHITPGRRGRRSKYAATWLWSYLTDGDWMLAPALKEEDMINAREVYRTMEKGVLVNCRSALIKHSSDLLAKLPHR